MQSGKRFADGRGQKGGLRSAAASREVWDYCAASSLAEEGAAES
jgi:hypothetical protein